MESSIISLSALLENKSFLRISYEIRQLYLPPHVLTHTHRIIDKACKGVHDTSETPHSTLISYTRHNFRNYSSVYLLQYPSHLHVAHSDPQKFNLLLYSMYIKTKLLLSEVIRETEHSEIHNTHLKHAVVFCNGQTITQHMSTPRRLHPTICAV